MKIIFLFSFLGLLAPAVFAQQKLFYFINADSTAVGVKNDSGKVIIPAKFSAIVHYDFENPITKPTIEFWGLSSDIKSDIKSPAFPAGEVYDRNGNFLYYAQYIDNGPDYWEEGVRRFVENNKMGFVNKAGQKIIPAQWAFAVPFNYGYAEVFEGNWQRKYEQGSEHWRVVPASDTTGTSLINKKGKRIEGTESPQHPKDYFFKGKYYPYPFAYTPSEQQMVDSLNALNVLNDINLVNYYTDTERSKMLLQFEIIEYPSSWFPYYTLQGFVMQQKNGKFCFAVSPDGKTFFHLPYFEEDGLKPLRQWIVEELEDCRKFMHSHKASNTFRFDADKALKEWTDDKRR